MKHLLLVTYIDFWNKGSGHRTRLNSLTSFLADYVQITVFFAGREDEHNKRLLKRDFPHIHFEFAVLSDVLTFGEYKEKFRDFIKDRFFDIVLVEYIELSVVLELLPQHTITILDTHDIVYKRVQSFSKHKLKYDDIVLSKKEELHIYRCFDYIILIQKTDFKMIAKNIDKERLLLVPHPPVLKRKTIRIKATDVGYIASSYMPNVDALEWFMKQVWNEVFTTFDLTLHIYGSISFCFQPEAKYKDRRIIFHGLVDDLERAYDDLDIIINPIRCGSGLKIKNIEALGFGLPLITSTHGASGMEDGMSKAFLVADHPKEYLSAFNTLLSNLERRVALAENAYLYAQSNFSKEKCYADLLRVVT